MTTKEKLELMILGMKPGQSINFAEIARQLGVTRQQISWLANKKIDIALRRKIVIPQGFLPAETAAKALGYRHKTLWKFAEAGRIQKVKIKNRTYWNVRSFIVKSCSVCEKPLPKGRVNKCSDRCREVAAYACKKKRQWKRWREKDKGD